MNRLLQFDRSRRRLRFHLEPGRMHLCSAFDVILALLLSAKTPPFPALLKRQFCRSGCFGGARHDFLPGY